MTTFGLQNQVIRKTPAGYIDSAFLDGNDGSDVFPSWNISSFPGLVGQTVGTPFSIDLAQFLTDPGSPSAEIGFHTVSGVSATQAGYTLTGTVLSNGNAVAASGTFQLVAVRKNVSVLSGPISFSIVAPAGVDNIAPTVATGITAAAGTASGSLIVTFDPPCDIAPGSTPASGTTGVNIYINGAISSPPSPIVSPANALAAPTNVNIGSMSNPFLATQSQKTWALSAQGTGIASTSSEQVGFLDFGSFSSSQRFVAKLDAYTSSAGTALMGLMIHETAAAGGKFLAVGLGPSNGTTGLYVITRPTASTASSQVATQLTDSNGAAIVGPVYIKISRSTDLQTVTLSYSLNENNWIVFYTATIPMNSSIHYGAFITSQNASVYASGVIEEISLTNATRISTTLTFATSNPVNVQLQSIDSAGNLSALSTVLVGVPQRIQQQQGQVKFHAGHYFWLDNSQWGSLVSPGAEQTAFVNFVAANSANTNIQGVEVYLRHKDIEGATQGDYSIAKANIDFIFNTVKAQPRRLRVMLVIADRDYTGGSHSVSTATWPQYMVTNGWAITGPTGNFTNSILNFNNSSAVSAFAAAVKNVCAQYNSEPLLEMVMIGMETSDPYSGATAWTAATYLAALKTIYSTVVPASPNTLIRVPMNFLSFQPTQDSDLVALIQYLRALKPGGFALGGPDPEISVGYIIHAAALWRGANVNGVQGIDNRGAMPFVVEIQGPYGAATTPRQMFNYCVGNPVGSLTGTYPNNPTGTVTGPSQTGMTPANWQPNHGWYIMWRSDDTSSLNAFSFINANGPLTLPGIPSEGTWNTA